ncbi:MAG: hypothetical protein Q8O22_05465 [Candidatus Omnitrophota bacterium]|nr:hypothetical protein [Candidatus Omnitrophota bacterium]
MFIFKGLHRRLAQNLLEYTVLVAVISAALLAMSLYIHRSINARLKQAQIELDESKR